MIFHLKQDLCCKNNLFNSKIIDLWRLPEYQRKQLFNMKNNIVLDLCQMLIPLFFCRNTLKINMIHMVSLLFLILFQMAKQN